MEKDKKEVTNILIKRGSEWHNPDFMRINAKHVLVVEPVASNSRVAQLIREAKAAPPPRPEGAPTTVAPKAESPSGVPAPKPAQK